MGIVVVTAVVAKVVIVVLPQPFREGFTCPQHCFTYLLTHILMYIDMDNNVEGINKRYDLKQSENFIRQKKKNGTHT